jgi:hypothetical protein
MNVEHSSVRALEHFRASKRRLPLHPLEKAVLSVVAIHLCFLPWALGTMPAWSQLVSLGLSALSFGLALIPRLYTGDLNPGIQVSEDRRQMTENRGQPQNNQQPTADNPQVSGFRSQVFQNAAFRLNPFPRLLRFPIFWLGAALLLYIGIQASNPSWVWTRNATTWWLVRVNDIDWLPTSIDTPFDRFNIWRQFIIYASAWLTVCTVWTGFTRRRSLQVLLTIVLGNAVLLAAVGFAQRFTASSKFLFFMEWPVGHTAFASFIYRNHAGAYFALMTFVAVSLAIWTFTQGERASRKSTPAGLLFFCAVLLSTAVMFSMSRGATLLLVLAWIAVAIWFWLSRRNAQTASPTHPGVYAAVVILFLGVIGFSIREVDFSSIQSRFDSLAKNYENVHIESVQSRVLAHTAAESMLSDYWIRGVGAGGFRYLYPEYIKQFPEIYAGGHLFWEHAHSDWREIPIELGLTGSLLLVAGGFYWLRVFYRGRAFWHSLAIPVLIGCSQTLAHAWFDFPFQNPALLCTWLALIAVSARWLELDAS